MSAMRTGAKQQAAPVGDAIRRLLLRVMPWYDHDAAHRRHERSEQVVQRAIATRIRAERRIGRSLTGYRHVRLSR